ncbi:hypothetical protein EJ110_NYTH58353 [Nymphaea thermarum]|nr:hypothetical protein EJ110_NYTH58353 [Nymphaea thermarum]
MEKQSCITPPFLVGQHLAALLLQKSHSHYFHPPPLLTLTRQHVVLSDLSNGLVLASDLHLVYLVTPINVEVEPDWELYYERFMELKIIP